MSSYLLTLRTLFSGQPFHNWRLPWRHTVSGTLESVEGRDEYLEDSRDVIYGNLDYTRFWSSVFVLKSCRGSTPSSETWLPEILLFVLGRRHTSESRRCAVHLGTLVSRDKILFTKSIGEANRIFPQKCDESTLEPVKWPTGDDSLRGIPVLGLFVLVLPTLLVNVRSVGVRSLCYRVTHWTSRKVFYGSSLSTYT